VPCRWRGWAGSLRSQTFGCLRCFSGSGECSCVAGTVDFVEDWCNSSRCDWLWDMATIGEEDRLGPGCGMGSGGRPNISAKAWRRSCTLLVLVLW
jgi:hypothetical protein